MSELTYAEHRARLEEMATALRTSSRKPAQAVSVLKGYIRAHRLAADVALFPDGSFTIVWQE